MSSDLRFDEDCIVESSMRVRFLSRCCVAVAGAITLSLPLSPDEVLPFCIVFGMSGEAGDGAAEIPYSTFQAYTHMSVSTLRRVLRKLAAKGYVTIDRRRDASGATRMAYAVGPRARGLVGLRAEDLDVTWDLIRSVVEACADVPVPPMGQRDGGPGRAPDAPAVVGATSASGPAAPRCDGDGGGGGAAPDPAPSPAPMAEGVPDCHPGVSACDPRGCHGATPAVVPPSRAVEGHCSSNSFKSSCSFSGDVTDTGAVAADGSAGVDERTWKRVIWALPTTSYASYGRRNLRTLLDAGWTADEVVDAAGRLTRDVREAYPDRPRRYLPRAERCLDPENPDGVVRYLRDMRRRGAPQAPAGRGAVPGRGRAPSGAELRCWACDTYPEAGRLQRVVLGSPGTPEAADARRALGEWIASRHDELVAAWAEDQGVADVA